MNDNQIKGMMVIAVLCISLLLIPLQVSGETEHELCTEEGQTKEYTLPIIYEDVTAEAGTDPDKSTVYTLEGTEVYQDLEKEMQFSLSQGQQPVIFRISHLTVSRDGAGESTLVCCDFRMSVSKADPEDRSEITLAVTKEPLPAVRMSGNAAVHIEYGWYDSSEESDTPVWPLVIQDFVPGEQEELEEQTEPEEPADTPAAQDEEAEQQEKVDEPQDDANVQPDDAAEPQVATIEQQETELEQPDHGTEQQEAAVTEAEPVKEGKTSAEKPGDVPAKAGASPEPKTSEKSAPVVKVKETPVISARKKDDGKSSGGATELPRKQSVPVTKTISRKDRTVTDKPQARQKKERSVVKDEPLPAVTDQKDAPVQRTLTTMISKPMNHVRISEQVTSGKTKIDKDSIRVRYNGVDVTDNCIIKMNKDGFTVDTQMNTNSGDNFVTTYSATPEGDEPIGTISTTYAEDPETATTSYPEEEPAEANSAVGEDETPDTDAPGKTKHSLLPGCGLLILLGCGAVYFFRAGRRAPGKQKEFWLASFVKIYRGWLTEG